MDDDVMIVRLSTPENRNSLTPELRAELGRVVEQAEQRREVRAVFLTGDGPSFCSGGDLKMLQTASAPWPVHRRFRGLTRWLVPLIQLEKPVIVGVNGHAVGGGMGLALAGDLILAGESAKFMAGFFRLGAVPDIGMMYHLPRLVGMARAKQFLFGNLTLSAQQAADWGIVSEVVPDEELFDRGLAAAKKLASGPAEVMGLAKSLLARSYETSLHDMFSYEGLGQALAMSSPEFEEGLSAALESRRPDFAAVSKADQESRQ
ncbi:MAG: enoyl-CoA hydratase/isomerase family protein [Burkholderiaceae bacterium]